MGISSISQFSSAPSNGLIYITSSTFSAVISASVDGCFTSAYDDYRILVGGTQSTTAQVNYRLRASGTDESGATYNWQQNVTGSTINTGARSTGQTSVRIFDGASDEYVSGIDLLSPALAVATRSQCFGSGKTSLLILASYAGYNSNATSYDGITILASSGTITGYMAIYGYRKAL